MDMTASRARALYLVLAVAALGLITSTNRLGAWSLRAVAPHLLFLAGLCIPSLLVCVLIYLSVHPARPFGPPHPHTPWSRLARLAGMWLGAWLAGSAVAALVVGHWIRYATDVPALVCFVMVGPLQEELLYRGALFELAERGWPSAPRWSPIVATTVPFALQHLQFHGYRFSAAALFQVAFTVPMGLVFGRLRQASGSLWPGLAAHVLTNLAGAFGTPPSP